MLHSLSSILRTPKNSSESQQSWSHWVLIALFGVLCFVPISGKLLFILGFVLLAAFIKGPLMIVVSAIFAFLISLIPPLAWVLSLFFVINELFFLARNWRFGLIAGFFFTYPFLRLLIERALPYPPLWEKFGTITIGMLFFYSLLVWFYRKNPNSHALVWSIVSLPFDCLVRFFPRFSRSSQVAKRASKKSVHFKK